MSIRSFSIIWLSLYSVASGTMAMDATCVPERGEGAVEVSPSADMLLKVDTDRAQLTLRFPTLTVPSLQVWIAVGAGSVKGRQVSVELSSRTGDSS